MLKTVMIATGIVGVAAFSVWPSLATLSTHSWANPAEETRAMRVLVPGIGQANDHTFDSHRYIVQRESSKPPGESRSGRASSRRAGTVPESKRESGIGLDPSQHPTHPEMKSNLPQKPDEPTMAPQKDGDSLEGERKSQTPFKRRGGVVE